MRVLFCLHSFPAPSLTFVNNQITGLLDRGFDVRIVSHKPAAAAPVHADVRDYGLVQRTSYVGPSRPESPLELGRLLLAFGRRRPSRTELRRAFAELAKKSPEQAWRLLRRAGAFLSHWPFDVIVCHFGPIGAATQELRDLGLTRAPMATFFHGYDVSRTIDEHGVRLYRRLFAAGELLLPISDYWRTKLLRLGAPAERTEVHRMGVDCSKIAFRPRVLAPGDKVRVLSVARLTEKKGLDHALQALARVRHRFAEFHYDVVGDGELRQALERSIAELGLAPWVTLHGWKSQEEIAPIRDRAHLLLQPSVTASDGDQEGLPVVLMEALAAGMPAISTLHTGIPELVENGRSGLLVAERDDEALAAALLALMQRPECWPEFGRVGRAKVEKDFDIEVLNDELVRRLRRLQGR